MVRVSNVKGHGITVTIAEDVEDDIQSKLALKTYIIKNGKINF